MSGPSALERRVSARLSDLRAAGLSRSLRPPAGIDFSSNDYLGLATHPLLRERMTEAIARDGCGSTGSRMLRGERASFGRLELRFAAFKNTERSLYFSSGYLANLAVLSALPEAEDVIYSDQLNHASLIDGMRLSKAGRVIFPHADATALERLLREGNSAGQKFIVTESLFSMDGDIAPLVDYAALCQAYDATLIVDEAHAVGVYGVRGSGLIEELGVNALVSINTASKALGVSGAFVAGPSSIVEFLIQQARPFVFSTAAPPSVAAALEASLDVIGSEPWRRHQLRARSRYLRNRLAADVLASPPPGESQIIPVVLGYNDRAVRVAQILQREGFDARAIRPPSVPPGTARLRLAVNANLSEAELDRFVDALADAFQEISGCSVASS